MQEVSTSVLPEPVPVRTYRYSRLRWRVMVRVIDSIGYFLIWCIRLVRPIPKTESIRRILIVQLDHLGDAVLTTTMLPSLKSAWPQAEIHVLASVANADVFRASGHVECVNVADRNWFERRSGCWAMLTAAWKLGHRMRAGKYDLGIDVRGDILSIFLMVLAGIKLRAGWSMGGGGFWLTHTGQWLPARHEVLSRMELLRTLGIEVRNPRSISPELTIREEDRINADRQLSRLWTPHQWLQACVRGEMPGRRKIALSQPLVVVHPVAGTQAKRWPIAYWRRLIDGLRDAGNFVAVIGSSDDRPLNEMLRRQAGVIDLTGELPLTTTLAILERAELFVGVDSGPAHLAAVTRTPSVILFSGTNDPAQWRPWSRKVLGLKHRVACSPCHKKLCPLADHPCMTGLSPERVLRMSIRWRDRNRSTSIPQDTDNEIAYDAA
jgi:ADP-heptose:LPS heptosyltransferase